jgi:hypothetical protein
VVGKGQRRAVPKVTKSLRIVRQDSGCIDARDDQQQLIQQR